MIRASKISTSWMTSLRVRASAWHLHQGELPRDHVLGVEVADLDDVDELVELLGHLLDREAARVDRDRHARAVRVLGRADGEGVDVEAAPGEQAGHAGQDAGLVLHQDREGVLHGARSIARSADRRLRVAPGAGSYPCAHGGPAARRRGRSAGPGDADPGAAVRGLRRRGRLPTAPRRWRRCGRRGRTCCCSTCCCPTPTASSCAAGCASDGDPRADPDAHRPRHGVGPGGRLRGRRRRLPGQALLHGRAGRAGAGPAAARRATARRPPRAASATCTSTRSTHEVRRGGRAVRLTRREFDLLAVFIDHPGRCSRASGC